MPVPNSIPVKKLLELAHDVCVLVLDDKYEYVFRIHCGGISRKDRAVMDEKEREVRQFV